MIHSDGMIGIIAGTGELPAHIARSLHRSGKNIFVAGLHESDPTLLDSPHWESARIDFHRMQDVLDILRQAGVTEVVLAGKVEHAGIYRNERFDERTLRFLQGLKDSRGATILSAVMRILEQEGYTIPSLLSVAPDLVPGTGPAIGPQPGSRYAMDLKLGWPLVRKIADLDIGQTVVLKGGAVVAVEAMEGTDEAIRRALDLAGDELTVIKLAASDHDFRFDVPTIGKKTVEILAEREGCTLAFEAGRCFILHMEDVFNLAEEKGVTLLPCREDENGKVLWSLK